MSSSDRHDTPKIGAGTLNGMARQGLNELRNVIYPQGPGTDPGIYGNAVPSEIAQERENTPQTDGLLGKYFSKAPDEPAKSPERDDRGPERE